MSQQINLYEARLRPRREWLTGRRLGLALLLALAVLAGLGVVTQQDAARAVAELARGQGELAASQQQLAALGKARSERKVPVALKAQIDDARAQLASQQAVMALLDSGQLGNRSGFSALMSGFSELASNDLWLTGFSVSVGGQEIEIRGRLFDPGKLAAYVARLGQLAAFAGRRFAALDMQRADATPGAAGALPANPAAAAPSPHSAYIDFVLRSENAAEPANPAGGKR